MNLAQPNRVLFALLLAILYAGQPACSVGRGLVDQRPPEPEDEPQACDDALDCDSSWPDPWDAASVSDGLPKRCAESTSGARSCEDTPWEMLSSAGRTLTERSFTLPDDETTRHIVVQNVHLREVVIDVQGATRLEFLADSRLHGVVIEAQGPGAELFIRDADLDRVRLRGFERVEIVRTETANLIIEATVLRTENTSAIGLHIDVDELFFSGGFVMQAQLAFEHGAVVAGELEKVSVNKCGALTITSSRIISTRFTPCTDEPLTFFDVISSRSNIASDLYAVGSIFRQNLFREGGISAWGSSFDTSKLCEDSFIRADHRSKTACLACDSTQKVLRMSCIEHRGTPQSLEEAEKAEEGTEPQAYASRICEFLRKPPVCPAPFPKAPYSGS